LEILGQKLAHLAIFIKGFIKAAIRDFGKIFWKQNLQLSKIATKFLKQYAFISKMKIIIGSSKSDVFQFHKIAIN
jgi:hypothetical protein